MSRETPALRSVLADLKASSSAVHDPGAAHDLGVDKIFGRGTTPGEVASYLVHALAAPSEGAA